MARFGAKQFCTAFLVLATAVFSDQGFATLAFFYGEKPPVAELGHYQKTVVQPTQTSRQELQRLQKLGVATYAYVSIGELHKQAASPGFQPEPFSLGTNTSWNSWIMDLTTSRWQNYLRQHVSQLKEQGFDGIFLDTMDSYQVAPRELWPDQQEALTALIREFHQMGLSVLINRGFEVLPEISRLVDGMVVESLFQGWDQGKQRYEPVPAETRQQLLERLAEAKQFRFPIYIVDYVPSQSWQLAIETARKITELGFTPWVTTSHLHGLGVSNKIPVPRRLLAFYNGEHSSLAASNIHLKLAPIAEYLGYRLDYRDISQPFTAPADFLYQGAVLWPGQVSNSVRDNIYTALDYFHNIELPFLLLGDTYISDPDLNEKLGFQTAEIDGKTKTTHQHPIIGNFEAPLGSQRPGQSLPVIQDSAAETWLTVEDETGTLFSSAFRHHWGAVVAEPYIIETGYQNNQRWLINPYEMLRQGLQLPDIPVADTTTENGRRLLITHIDGDGFVNKGFFPGTPYASEVIRDQILKRYPFYTTVSVIEAETSPKGVYPHHSANAEDIARSIFTLNNVEAASHTYSHPFAWENFDNKKSRVELIYGNHLPVPGYKNPSLEREITGSVDYINSQLLAGTGKKADVFLWSGNAVPTEKAIQLIEQQGLLNMNGGETVIRNSLPSLTNVTGIGRPLDSGWQIYAPIMNENVYTNNWSGPFYGYRHAIETFQRTDRPHRLKPLNIYYHFYSGDKPASLKALTEVYDWVKTQNPVSIYASEYIQRAKAFYRSSFTRDLAGNWHVVSEGPLRSLRFPKTLGRANIRNSENLVGKNTIRENYEWLHLYRTPATISTATGLDNGYLIESNGIILDWKNLDRQSNNNALEVQLRAAQPLMLTLKGNCRFEGKSPVNRQTGNGISHFQFEAQQISGRFRCD